MKYWSETLNKVFDTEAECQAAEEEHAAKKAEAEARKNALVEARANRAKEVEDAYKAAVAAKKNYDDLLKAFLKDYGSFHATFKDVDPFFSLFDWF